MSEIEFWKQLRRDLKQKDAPVPMCSFCGDAPATGWWRGEIDVYCCYSCATEVLPALLADSVFPPSTFGHNAALSSVNDAKNRAEKTFWRAIFLVALRQCKKVLSN
jgi:hypothetical protein